MKKIETRKMKLALVATALLMLPGIVTLAQTKINLRMHKTGTEIALLSIDSIIQEKPVTITIMDDQGYTLFTDKSKGGDYSKMIDFSKVKKGKYFVDVAHSDKVSRSVIAKADTGMAIQKENYYLYNHLTMLNQDKKKLLVKFMTNTNEKVHCVISDNDGHIIHEADINSEDYAALFNLKNLSRGMYNMTFTSGTFSNSKSFMVN